MADWKDFMTLSPVGEGVQQVYYRNSKFIGHIVQDVDGYWKYGFPNSHGLWEDSTLQMIADMLIELNMEWDASIKEYFDNERLEESRTSQLSGEDDE